MARDELKYSIVIPVYNSSKTLEDLCTRIHRVFENLQKSYDIILVDDASADHSWQMMKKIQKEQPSVNILQLMKNFGQHNAIACGLHYVTGHFAITMDDDLQHPPEEIPKLIAKIDEGYDVVYGAMEKKHANALRKAGSNFFHFLNRAIFRTPKDLKLSSFRILSKEIVDEIIKITRKVANAAVRHDHRQSGESTYSLFKLIKLTFNLVFNFSNLPLQFLSLVGALVSILSFSIAIYFVLKKIFVGIDVPGWTSVICLLSFFNGLLMMITSIIGEYLARIIKEVSNNQQFILRHKILNAKKD